MFHRSVITKRVIALCGVWLTLVSCMQQTHAFCGLSGCLPTQEEQLMDECCHECDAVKKCSHFKNCDCTAQADLKPSSPKGADSQPAQPCDEGCWCCQPPSPQQAPAPLDAVSITQLSAISCDSIPAIVSLDVVVGAWATTLSESSPQRAIDTCVRLCRFLA